MSRLNVQTASPKTVLLVEDDPEALEELSEIIELEGWRALTTNSAEKAMKILENREVDVVVTDVHFGKSSDGMTNGIQLVSRAQAKYPDRNLSFVVLSGDVDAVNSSLQTGAVDFLLKPIDSDDLVKAVCMAHETSGKERTLSDVTDFLLEKSSKPHAEGRSPNSNLLTAGYSDMRRQAAASQEKALIMQFALGRDLIQPWFQPVVDFKSHRVLAFEALARWVDPSGECRDAEEFIACAEQSHTLEELDDRVRAHAITAMSHFEGLGNGATKLLLRIQVRQAADAQAVKRLSTAVADAGFSLKHVAVELEDPDFLVGPDAEAIKSNLQPFQNRVLRVDIKDFAAGCGCLAGLRGFDFEWVRIGLRSTPNWHRDPRGSAAVRGLIAVAHSVGVKVLADGVEDQEVFDWLKSEGCDAAQGHLIGAVMPPQEALEWAQNRLSGEAMMECEV